MENQTEKIKFQKNVKSLNKSLEICENFIGKLDIQEYEQVQNNIYQAGTPEWDKADAGSLYDFIDWFAGNMSDFCKEFKECQENDDRESLIKNLVPQFMSYYPVTLTGEEENEFYSFDNEEMGD